MHYSKQDITHYLVLVLGLIVFSVVFVVFKFQQVTQAYIAFFGSLFYAAWGILHHALEGRLNKVVALEYILLSALVFILIVTVLYI